MELTEVSEESLKEALEVVDQLEQMQMEVLKEMKEEANQGAGNVEAGCGFLLFAVFESTIFRGNITIAGQNLYMFTSIFVD